MYKKYNERSVQSGRVRRCVSQTFAALAVLVGSSPLLGQAQLPSGMKYSGDFRLRYENTHNQQPGSAIVSSRSREVVRFRAGISKEVNEYVHLGARLATGSQDDPNTADQTLGNFVDDLQVSLDRVFIQMKYQGLNVTGGKFANPFLKTDLVWDGDVNPQGMTASYSPQKAGKVTPKVVGMYSIVDEHANSNTPDSHMWGAQLQLAMKPSSDFGLTLAGGYYDYRIKSLSNADAGDTRSNYLDANGTGYMSDFDLFNAIAIVDLKGFSPSYPVKLIGDFVKNNGAAVAEDTGYSFDVFVGKASNRYDKRFRYGYSQTETDAVLAAFSNDNTTIATNYKQHTVTFDYVVLDNTTLNLTWYYYRANDLRSRPETNNEYVSRLRLNAVVKF